MLGNISKLYCMQGTNKINAIIKGNNIIQQKDINWSNRILGNEALTHMNTKIIIDDFKPKLTPYNNPSIIGFENQTSLFTIYTK